jgi:glucosyl-3-phosphoglycerate synthase
MGDVPTYRVMLVMRSNQNTNLWTDIASRFKLRDTEVHLRGIVTLPPEVSLSEGALQAQQWRETLSRIARDEPSINDNVRVIVDYEPYRRIIEEINALEIDLLLAEWSFAQIAPDLTTFILQSALCDVVLLDGVVPDTTEPVLLSLRGGPNITLGVFVAKAIAQPAPITLFHVTDRQRIAPDLKVLLQNDPQIERVVTTVSNIRDGILREIQGHKALVIGATFYQPDAQHSAASPIVQQIREQTDLPIALVRAYNPETFSYHLPVDREEESVSTRVDRWFAENTFDSSEFADLAKLVDLKQRQGLSISLGLPALNEEATVGKVISILKRALKDDVPLIDEIVLIDSNSTDRTVEIAEAAGIPVYRHPDILAEVGTVRGKGEALWKSLAVLKGDLIAWVDTDITNIHPRFVYGLLGPLLKYPHIQYVKGYYQRPIKVGQKMQASGGGRVTELLARPVFNLFYPELSGVVQPLSGEYAGRRQALMSVPFFSGYGVETGLLIDLLERYGLEALAQTNLEVRVHHNQPLVNLSKMAFAILQVFVARIEKRHGIELLDKANRSMKLILQEPDRLALEMEAIGDIERPPMNTVLAEAFNTLTS